MENDNHEEYGNPRNTGRRGLQGEAKTTLLKYKKGLKRPTLAWNEMSFVTLLTTGKLMERTDCGQEACSGLRKKKRTPPKPRRIQTRNNHLGKRSQIFIRCLRRIPEEGTNSGRGGRSGRCVQQSAIQIAGGTPCAIWRQLDAHKMARSSTPGKKGCHATWKLDLHTPITDNGTSTRLPPVPCPPQCLHKGTGGSEQNGLSRVLMLAYDGLIYKTASEFSTAVTAVQEQLEKASHWCQETESEINPSKAQALWCILNNKTGGQAMSAVPFNGEVIERANSLRYLGIRFDRMLTRRRSNQQNSGARNDCPR